MRKKENSNFKIYPYTKSCKHCGSGYVCWNWFSNNKLSFKKWFNEQTIFHVFLYGILKPIFNNKRWYHECHACGMSFGTMFKQTSKKCIPCDKLQHGKLIEWAELKPGDVYFYNQYYSLKITDNIPCVIFTSEYNYANKKQFIKLDELHYTAKIFKKFEDSNSLEEFFEYPTGRGKTKEEAIEDLKINIVKLIIFNVGGTLVEMYLKSKSELLINKNDLYKM